MTKEKEILESDFRVSALKSGGIFLLLIFAISFYFWQKNQASYLQLLPQNNKFKLIFNINHSDEEKLSAIFQKLNIPQNITEDREFELDATSTAKLAFISPVTTKIILSPDKIQFSGQLTANPSVAAQKLHTNLKIPPTTTIAVFAPDFKSYLKEKLRFPAPHQLWLEQNISSDQGQYFLVKTQNDNQSDQDLDFALIFKKSTPINFQEFAQISEDDQESAYKQEIIDDMQFHLLKFPMPEDNRQITLTFFQIGQWFFMASSQESAKDLFNVQTAQASSVNFWPQIPKQPVSFAVLWQNSDKNISHNVLTFLTGQKLPQVILDTIQEARFVLNEREFTGSISL